MKVIFFPREFSQWQIHILKFFWLRELKRCFREILLTVQSPTSKIQTQQRYLWDYLWTFQPNIGFAFYWYSKWDSQWPLKNKHKYKQTKPKTYSLSIQYILKRLCSRWIYMLKIEHDFLWFLLANENKNYRFISNICSLYHILDDTHPLLYFFFYSQLYTQP